MKQSEARKIALGAIRSEARHHGWKPEELSAEDALTIMDDMYRMDSRLIASIWYGEASDSQIKSFKREWNAWKKGN